MSTEPRHVPVLLEEVLHFLDPARGGCFVDCTLGLGGHARALLERFPDTHLVGLDRDSEALAVAAERLSSFGSRVQLVEGRFGDVAERLEALGIGRVSGVLADLGVSSLQLDRAGRGFSFAHEGPLDMRMGAADRTAADVVNGYPEDALSKILKTYGEEPQARRIARAIVEERRGQPFETTAQLAELIERTKRPIRHRGGRGKRSWSSDRSRRIHPATQVFQALRIEVNQEIQELEQFLDQSVEMLEQEGRLVVISYHSLEDRPVKHHLRRLAEGEIEPVTGQPRAETQILEVLTRKPVRPTEAEIEANPRSRSARLRAGKRL